MGELGKGLMCVWGGGAQLSWRFASVEPWLRESVGMWGLRGGTV